MSGEHISREAAIKSTWMILEGMGYPRSENRSLEKTVEAVFKSAPAADVVEVRHGRFLGTEFEGYADERPVYFEWQCSACGCIFEDEEPAFRFCPWCGAKMDLPEPPKEKE